MMFLSNRTRFPVMVERGANSFGARVPDLPGCVAVGKTREEALALIREAVDFHMEGLNLEGRTLPASAATGDRDERSTVGRVARGECKPLHPGEVIRSEIMVPLGISVAEAG